MEKSLGQTARGEACRSERSRVSRLGRYGSAAPHFCLQRKDPSHLMTPRRLSARRPLRAVQATFYLSFSVGARGVGGGSSVFPARETISLPACCFRVRAPLCRGRALQDAFITLPPCIHPIRADTASCCMSAIATESKMCMENSQRSSRLSRCFIYKKMPP